MLQVHDVSRDGGILVAEKVSHGIVEEHRLWSAHERQEGMFRVTNKEWYTAHSEGLGAIGTSKKGDIRLSLEHHEGRRGIIMIII